MNKWISIEESLPEIQEVVLLYQSWPKGTFFTCVAHPLHRSFFIVGGLTDEGKFVSYWNQYSEEGLEHITHWMPLTAPEYAGKT